MIDFAAKHISFVIASYAITIAVMGALLVWVLKRQRAMTDRLTRLEADGASRRRKSSKEPTQ